MRHAAARPGGIPTSQELPITIAPQPDPAAGRIIGGVVIGVAAVVAAASITAAALTIRVARTVLTPPKRRVENLWVLGVTESSVTLTATADSLLPGQYGLWFDGGKGYARIGRIVGTTPGTVTRELIAVDEGVLLEGMSARPGAWFYLSPHELGVEWHDVVVDTELGEAPAWLIPAESPGGSWVINVHGRAVRRQETLRAVPAFRAAGYTSLLVSYRNDGDAPDSADLRYSLGDSEWRDIEAAMRFAVDRGATDIVLMGWSMGGAIVLQAATRSPLARYVRGIVLDSPVLDWASVLGFQGSEMRLPPAASHAVLAVIGNTWGRRLTGQAESIDLARLDFVTRAGELSWPTLLIHSDDDGYVPSGPSHQLAAARPDIVTFDVFQVARHTKLWNYDPARWNLAITSWLARLDPHSSGRTGRSGRRPAADAG
jgi:pimeloyl-ACP methyl ester carboxylesterase